MMHRTALIAMLCAALAQSASAQDPNVVGVDPAVPHQALVRILPHATVDSCISLLEAAVPGLSVTVLDSIESRRIYLLELDPPAGTTDDQIAAAYLEPGSPTSFVGDPGAPDDQHPLRWGELNYLSETAEGKTGSGYVSGPQVTAANYTSQYAQSLLGLDSAQSTTRGGGVVVAILDTGIDATHPVFADNVLAGYNFVTGGVDTADVGDGVDNDGDGVVNEMVGHGTYVAGLITLTAPDAMLLPVTVLNPDGTAGGFRIAKGMFYAIDRGVEVINMSLGSTYKTEAVSDAVEEAKRLGIPVVASAGNFDREDPREYPAMVSSAFGVVATDDDDRKASFSNFSPKAFICAPGTSTRLSGDPNAFDPARSTYSAIPGGDYAAWDGTSMATCYVTGAIALIRAQHPEWAPDELTYGRIEAALAGTAVDIYPLNPGFTDELGAGRLDVAAAVSLGPIQPRLGDLNADGAVTLSDLARLLADYGTVHSSADFDGSGRVDLTDLGMLLANYGL